MGGAIDELSNLVNASEGSASRRPSLSCEFPFTTPYFQRRNDNQHLLEAECDNETNEGQRKVQKATGRDSQVDSRIIYTIYN